jgi:hypothetical protein
MQNNSEKIWPWPKELDALTAAPQHHRLLMENDTVRVIDTCIPPGEITAVHTHQWPASLYIISWSDFIRYDAEWNVVVDSRQLKMSPSPGTALWTESLKPHALRNMGDRDLHIISVEIKS